MSAPAPAPEPTEPTIVELILSVMETQLGLARPEPTADLLADGLLDSLSLLDLLAAVEASLGVTLDVTQLEFDDLASVCSLAAFVERSR